MTDQNTTAQTHGGSAGFAVVCQQNVCTNFFGQ
jgi:hypothetical protein